MSVTRTKRPVNRPRKDEVTFRRMERVVMAASTLDRIGSEDNEELPIPKPKWHMILLIGVVTA